MPSVVTVTWVPLKKDSPPPNPEDYKDYPLPKGLLTTYSGKPADPNEPAAVELVSVWESVDAVKASHQTAEGQKFRADLEAMQDTSNPDVKAHNNIFVFSDDFTPVAEAAVTQQTIVFVPTSVDKAAFTAAWEEAIKNWTKPDGWVAGVYGWSEDQLDQPPHIGTGKANGFLASAGWESIEKAQAAKEAAKAAFEPLSKFGIKPESAHNRFTTLTKAPR